MPFELNVLDDAPRGLDTSNGVASPPPACACPLCGNLAYNGPGDGPVAFLPPSEGTAGNGLPIFDWDEVAAQLTRNGVSWTFTLGAPVEVTYAFRIDPPGTMPSGTSMFSQFTAEQIAFTEMILSLWADVANITFTRVTEEGSEYSNNASMLFGNYGAGADGASAFAYYPWPTATGPTDWEGDVWINISLASNAALTWGGFGAQTISHEIGHALGLAHPANYDALSGEPVTYPESSAYWQDSRAYTVMSYFGSAGVGHSLNAFAFGPQLHDIAAIQLLYGANMTTRTGDTVYGFNSNTGLLHYSLTTGNDSPVFSIWDAGGNDTLDFSGYSSNSEIDLREQAFSSAGPGNGGVGVAIGNISIARGAIIENAIGGAGNDTIIGNAVANQLTGNGGNDSLDGGLGADTLRGGLGDDNYIVDNVGDVVVELSGQGVDHVSASVSYATSANVENLTLTGVAAINGQGNALNNVITGNSAVNELFGFGGNDTLDGGAGADRMYGGEGDDTYIVDNVADQTFEANVNWGTDTALASVTYWLGTNIDNLTLTGSTSINGFGNDLNNWVIGNSAANQLFGFAGNDTLDGGEGGDQMYAGQGDDTYIVDNINDVAFEANADWGTDTVLSSVSYFLSANLENMTLTGVAAINAQGNANANILIGNGAANQLFGYGGNDTLDGGAGADQMYGGEGDDTYIVDNVGDVVFEANVAWGIDTVMSSVTWTLSSSMENLTLTGTAGINGSGNGLNNIVIGNSASNTLFGYGGNDTLDGGAGNDFMYGGEGDDTYIVDSSADVTFEGNVAWGTDTVYASASYALGTNIDNLTLTGSANINGTGNDLANVIRGNSGNNTLNGGAGNDTFVFGPNSGDDTIVGFVAGGTDDELDLSAYTTAGITWTISQVGADTIFEFTNGDSITLLNTTAASLVQLDPDSYG